ncbi:MAG TPA: hypothetical protein PLK18_04290, partial [Fervidobacterium sp.]|nr:hypothetical protein [Fervidobacterium sp.]HPP18117.1 hypothetical protein [Fervidobacterium sp.]
TYLDGGFKYGICIILHIQKWESFCKKMINSSTNAQSDVPWKEQGTSLINKKSLNYPLIYLAFTILQAERREKHIPLHLAEDRVSCAQL